MQVIEFIDMKGNKVELSFSPNSFKEETRHVLVICQNGNDWILTKHKERGLEFPGGKMEEGESIEESARREVYEETGAVLDTLTRIGEYRVQDTTGAFVKAIFWGQVHHIDNKKDYFETNGPAVINGDILRLRFGEEYSFIMKDKVIELCIKQMEK